MNVGDAVRIDCPNTWGHGKRGVIEAVGFDIWGNRGGPLISVQIAGAWAPILYRPECLSPASSAPKQAVAEKSNAEDQFDLFG